MKRFTFIADFEGGTYLSQVEADHVGEALVTWGASLSSSDLGGLGDERLATLRAELASETPIAVRTLWSVWCASVLVGDAYLLIHIVDTRRPVLA